MHQTLQAYKQVIRLCDLSGPCQKSAIVFHFLLLFVTNKQNGKMRGNILWRSYLLAIHIPGDTGLVKATTMTIALIMRTMRINNERHESTVATFRAYVAPDDTNTQSIIHRHIYVLLERTWQTLIFCGACLLFLNSRMSCMSTELTYKVLLEGRAALKGECVFAQHSVH